MPVIRAKKNPQTGSKQSSIINLNSFVLDKLGLCEHRSHAHETDESHRVVLDPYEVLIKITTGNCVFPNICNENKCSVPGVRYKYESFSDGSEDAGGR